MSSSLVKLVVKWRSGSIDCSLTRSQSLHPLVRLRLRFDLSERREPKRLIRREVRTSWSQMCQINYYSATAGQSAADSKSPLDGRLGETKVRSGRPMIGRLLERVHFRWLTDRLASAKYDYETEREEQQDGLSLDLLRGVNYWASCRARLSASRFASLVCNSCDARHDPERQAQAQSDDDVCSDCGLMEMIYDPKLPFTARQTFALRLSLRLQELKIESK